MKILFPLFLTLLFCIYHLDAFLPASAIRRIGGGTRPIATITRDVTASTASPAADDDPSQETKKDKGFLVEKQTPPPQMINAPFTHADVIWKIRPPPEYPWWQRLSLRLACNALRLECLIQGRKLPTVLCPRGGRAQLECYLRDGNDNNNNNNNQFFNNKNNKRIAKFGITTQSGPPIPQIQETVCDLYGRNPRVFVSAAAIIYMYVEPEYRGRQLGKLALEVISLIHGCQNIDFTVLVANDKSITTTKSSSTTTATTTTTTTITDRSSSSSSSIDSEGKLVKWYEQQGYQRAPKLQEVFGSPDAIYGVTMIAPTNNTRLPQDCSIQWW